jgi:hypothetical protein
MSAVLQTAAAALADVLARENAALAALDLQGAAALLDAKRQAADAFTAAQGAGGAAARDAPALRALADRLRTLTEESRRLLENGLQVQGRVLGCVARAVPRALAVAQGGRARTYAPGGALAPLRQAGMVISARA